MAREEPDERWGADGPDGDRRVGSSIYRVALAKSGRPDGERGQTTLDFTVGVVLFLFVLAGIFMFVSGTLQPFTSGDQENIVGANRVADNLAEGTLGDPSRPHVLDTTCTVTFFEDGYNPDCRYENVPFRERLGVSEHQFVNVTVRGNVTQGTGGPDELLCWERTNGRLREQEAATCGGSRVPLAIGNTPPERSQSAVTARRTVSLDGTDVSLVVKLW